MSHDDTRDDAIDHLNSLLRGERAAVETYRQALEKADDERVQSILRENRASHAARVDLLVAEIRRLGGEPAQGSGAWGAFARAVEGGAKLFGTSTAVAALEEGEDRGLEQYCAGDDLPIPVQQIIAARLLPEQERTHNALAGLKKLTS